MNLSDFRIFLLPNLRCMEVFTPGSRSWSSSLLFLSTVPGSRNLPPFRGPLSTVSRIPATMSFRSWCPFTGALSGFSWFWKLLIWQSYFDCMSIWSNLQLSWKLDTYVSAAILSLISSSLEYPPIPLLTSSLGESNRDIDCDLFSIGAEHSWEFVLFTLNSINDA